MYGRHGQREGERTLEAGDLCGGEGGAAAVQSDGGTGEGELFLQAGADFAQLRGKG